MRTALHFMRRFFLSAGVVALLAGPVLAELADVRQALDAGNLDAGVNELKVLARGGDPEAQLLLGQIHLSGKGILKNQTLALYWVKKAAAQENAEAQYLAGTMYFEGKGTPISLVESERLLKLSATQGYPEAQYRLGLLYRSGHGSVAQDIPKAREWLGKAAEQGDVDAQLILDEMETAKAPDKSLSGLVQDRKTVKHEPNTETGKVRKVIVGVLDNMNGSLDGVGFDYRSAMIIKEKDDGDISVILPGAKLAMQDGGVLLLGSLRLTVKSQEVGDKPSYFFDVALPPRFRAVDTAGKIIQTISFRQNRFEMVWASEFDAFVKADISLSDITNQGKGDLFDLSMGRFDFSIDLKEDDSGRWSGDAFSVLVTDIAVHMGEKVKVASLKSLAVNAPFKGFDMQVYNRYIKRMTVDPVEVFAELQTKPGAKAFVDSMGSEQMVGVLLSGLQVQDKEGNPVFSLGS
ncbi:MAG: sel1 repeat family protein, partial [Rhodospirillaceae bacterium]|nr:sel1 repeat family protein [Rhodospirillaceae bacterium]